MPAKYYYDGANAKRIRTFTREQVMAVLTTALADAGYEIGEDENQIPMLKSGRSAEDRFKVAEPFVYFVNRPTRVERHQVVGHDDGKAHSGRKFSWTFLIQASAGKMSGEATDEAIKGSDDELMDAIRNAFEENYRYFRDTLHFYEMTIAPNDEIREGSGLNPLLLTFYNLTRMDTDEFITT